MSCRVLPGGGETETSFSSLAEAVSAAIPNCEIIIDGVVEVSVGEGKGARTGCVVTAQQNRLENAATASASRAGENAMIKFVSDSGGSAWSIA
jgi:hypothetical protein